MAAWPSDFNKFQFISAEINHDFYKPSPRLNEYQKGWQINTLCPDPEDYASNRNAGAPGDDALIGQILGYPPGGAGAPTPLNKYRLKHEFPPGAEYMISALVTPIIDLTASLPQYAVSSFGVGAPGVSIDRAITPDGVLPVRMYVAHANIDETDPRGIYGVFKYPDENFLIIDAVPNFVTSILKYLRFPTSTNLTAGVANTPDQYTTMTTQDLCNAPYWPRTDGQPVNWPFRPKINVINTPSTLGDPQPTIDPGGIKFSINARLPPHTLNSNTCNIPGGLDNVNNSCPLIYTWYYTQPEVSLANNALMMSSYQIIMRPLGSGYGYKQSQNWSGGATLAPPTAPHVVPAPGYFIGGSGNGAAEENSIGNLKKFMIAHNIIQKTPPPPPPPPAPPEDRYNVAPTSEAVASLLVQRKRSGDYLQIKTAYEFPALAAAHGNNRAVYELILGPQGAMDLGANPATGRPSTLSGEGNFKTEPSAIRTTQWYRNRTYFCTGDWPAFCYATYNRINCILICKRKNCAGATTNHHIIYRNYFGT